MKYMNKFTKINLGSGDHLIPGFLNLDERDFVAENFCRWNLKNGLPPHIADNSINQINSEHFFEHLMLSDGIKLMKQCKEKMIPGGRFTLALPNFRLLVQKYLEKDWGFFDHALCYAPNHQIMEIVNFSIYQYVDGQAEHKTQYDAEFACFAMSEAGFKNCREIEFNPEFNLEHRRLYTFYVEGIS